MQIKIKNFGPVRDFEIDLDKDFHLFVGKNNIGKSYAITAVYLIVKTFSEASLHNISFGLNSRFFFEELLDSNDVSSSSDKIISIGKDLKSKHEVDIKSYVISDIVGILEGFFAQKLKNSFTNTFTSIENLNNRYSNESPIISISQNGFSFDICISETKFGIKNLSVHRDVVLRSIKQNRDSVINDSKCTVYYCKGKEVEFRRNYYNLILNRYVFGFISDFSSLIESVHYLPASRSGLYQALSAFGQIIAELSKNRSFLSKKIELPGISEPVSDYFIRLSDIRVQKKSFENKQINKIAREIEDKILKGRVEFNPQTKQLMFYPRETNLKLELSSTSSMVSELAPIVSYLRYVLTANARRRRRRPTSGKKEPSQLIMIEEPEAHLHPEVQIMLTEIFSKLTHENVKLIITSHSNYIFNKVSNLIMSKNLNIDQVNSGVFKTTVKGSVLTSLDVSELGIEDDNFSDSTSELFDEKMDIISKMNEGVVFDD